MALLAARSAAERKGDQLRLAVAGLKQRLEIEHGAVITMGAVSRDLMRTVEVAADGGHRLYPSG